MRQLHDRARPEWWVAAEPPPWFADLDWIEEHFLAFWVAVSTNQPERIVGMLGADPSWSDVPPIAESSYNKVVYLARMRVDPDFQRRGIGARLCRELIDWASHNGYDVVVTNTTSRQPAAAALYEHVGFREVTRTRISEGSQHIWFNLPLSDHQLPKRQEPRDARSQQS